MAAIKDIPTNRKDYYNSCQRAFQIKYDRCTEERQKLLVQAAELYDDICNNVEYYKEHYDLDLNNIIEFRNNAYDNGEFYRIAKRLFLNKKDNHVMVMELYDLYSLVKLHKAIYNLEKQIHLAERVLSIKYKDYTQIIKDFYYGVHKHMILDGEAYQFGNRIGYLCINRCKVHRGYPMLDFEATRKNKERLIAEGKHLWNKAEAEYCRRIGVEYNAVDYRIYKNDEYYYEIPLLYPQCKFKYDLEFESSDYRAAKLRGTTHDDLLELCDNDPKKICKLDVDIRTKLVLCNKADKLLYANFIRNENQDKHNYTATNR